MFASLNDPSHIWENPFGAQLDDFGRALVLLVVLHGYAIHESQLAEAYQRFVSLPSSQSLQGRREYLTNLRLLTGSFLNRTISSIGMESIDLFNPSIGDYVLKRYSGDVALIQTVMLCLRTRMSLYTLMNLKREKHISLNQIKKICRSLLRNACGCGFEGFNDSYISKMIRTYIDLFGDEAREEAEILTALQRLMKVEYGQVSYDSYDAIKWAVEVGLVTPENAAFFVKEHCESARDDDEIRSMFDLIGLIAEESDECVAVADAAKTYVIGLISENFSEYIETSNAFCDVEYGDHHQAKIEIKFLIEEKLNNLGIAYDQSDISEIIGNCDVVDELAMYYMNFHDEGLDRVDSPRDFDVDEIDDLFERNS